MSTPIPPLLDRLVDAGSFVWRASWQAAVLAGLVLVVHGLIGRRIPPRWRHAMWLLVLVRLALPAVPSSPVSVFNVGSRFLAPAVETATHVPTAATVPAIEVPVDDRQVFVGTFPPMLETIPATTATPEPAPAPAAPPVDPWAPWRLMLAAGWAAGVLVLGLRLAWATLRLGRVLRRLDGVPDGPAFALLANTAGEFGIRRLPVLLTGEGLSGPALVGFVRPRLVLPRELLRDYDPAELRLVMLHELAHLKRHDVAVNWFATIVTVLHWPNPVAWFAAWRLRIERELACDEMVLAQAAGDVERRAYGHTILKLLETYARRANGPRAGLLPAGGVGILEGKQQMKRRITMIARFGKRGRGWTVLASALVLALGAVALTDAVGAEPSAAPAAADGERKSATPAAAVEQRGGDTSAELERKLRDDEVVRNYEAAINALEAKIQAAGGPDKPAAADDVRTRDVHQRRLDERREMFRGMLMEAKRGEADQRRLLAAAATRPAGPAGGGEAAEYVIGPDDLVQVAIYDLEGPGKQTIKSTRVSASGGISLPYLDDPVRIAGGSALEARRVVEKAYTSAGVLQRATVSLEVTEARNLKPVIRAGERIMISIMDLTANGVETTKTTRPDEDGNINLPYVGAVKAQGLRPAELEREVAKAYHAKGILQAAVVAVSLVDRGESHQLVSRPATANAGAAPAASQPAGQGGAAPASGTRVHAYDVADLLNGTSGPSNRMAELLQVVKVAAGPTATLTQFDTKIIVSAPSADHEAIEAVFKTLRDAPTTRPSTRPAAGAAVPAADMTAEDIAQVDPTMAKHLQIKQEIEHRLEQLNLTGYRENNPAVKTATDMLKIRDKIISERADWFRARYEGVIFYPGTGALSGPPRLLNQIGREDLQVSK